MWGLQVSALYGGAATGGCLMDNLLQHTHTNTHTRTQQWYKRFSIDPHFYQVNKGFFATLPIQPFTELPPAV